MSATQSTKFSPAWILFSLAPVVGELVPGFSPPFTFLNPFSSFFLFALYGAGAVLSRELAVRTGRSWPTILALGAAVELLKDGLMTASFFNPNLADPLASYGRFLGVNWVLLVQSMLFESVFAIAIPILLVNLLFPQRRSEPWLTMNGAWWLVGLLASGLVLGMIFLSPYRPSIIYYIVTVIAVVGIMVGSLNLPHTLRLTKSKNVAAPYVFGTLSFLATCLFALIIWLFPRSPLPAPIAIASMVGLALYVMRTVLAMSGDALKWKESQQAAFLTGALAFYVVLDPFKEWFPQGQDMRGMTFVAVGAAIFLVALNWWVRARTPGQQQYISRV